MAFFTRNGFKLVITPVFQDGLPKLRGQLFTKSGKELFAQSLVLLDNSDGSSPSDPANANEFFCKFASLGDDAWEDEYERWDAASKRYLLSVAARKNCPW